MGDPAKADPALIEDFHCLDDPAWRFGGSYLHVEANYLLLVENLLDTTHLPFLHPTSLGTDAFARSEFEVKREGDRITVTRWLMNELPAPFHKQMGDFPDGMKVDRWQITHFGPPCFVKLDVGSAPVGTGARQGDRSQGHEHVEPERDHPRDREDRALLLRAGLQLQARRALDLATCCKTQVHNIFLEDMAMIKAQQQNMDLGPSAAVGLGQDKAWMAMRSIVQRLIGEEQQAQRPLAVSA